jgi:hypothetical protein
MHRKSCFACWSHNEEDFCGHQILQHRRHTMKTNYVWGAVNGTYGTPDIQLNFTPFRVRYQKGRLEDRKKQNLQKH